MPSVKQTNKPGHTTRGDIFDDLGLSSQEALEAKVKADIWRDLLGHVEKRQMSQATLAAALKVHQPDISNLMRGKLSKFSTSKLITFAVRLNLQIQVKLSEPKKQRIAAAGVSTTTRAGKKEKILAAT